MRKILRVRLRVLRAFTAPFALCAIASLAQAEPSRDDLIAMGQKAAPPAMPHLSIAPPTTKPAGDAIDIVDGDCKTLLFVPAGYVVPADGKVTICVHFHGAEWFTIGEELRRGLNTPLLVVNLGQGSATYGKAFKDKDRFGRLVALIEGELSKRSEKTAHVTTIDMTSFSAGYGAVREIITEDQYFGLIRRLILCDSLYAGWDPATTQPGATSRPLAMNVDPYIKFAQSASRGENKTFVLTHSSVPTPYANTAATAKWLADLINAPHVDIAPNSSPASSDPDFPLLYRADLGHLHLWGYGGEDAQAHLTHVRHLADVWKALDACGEP